MADSEFQRPTLAENISMLRNDLFARLDVSDTLRRMDEDVRAKVYAAALHTVYGYIDYPGFHVIRYVHSNAGNKTDQGHNNGWRWWWGRLQGYIQ